MYLATVTRFIFYFIWTLFLIPQVIKSVDPIDDSRHALSRLKRSSGNDASSENTSDEETRKALDTDDDSSSENTRRAAAISSENSLEIEERKAVFSEEKSNEETRRAASSSNSNSDEELQRIALGSEDGSDEETRRAVNPPERDSGEESNIMRQSFWKKIMDNAIRNAVAPLEHNSGEDTRRAAVDGSTEDKSNEDTRRAATGSEENTEDETRRQGDSTDINDSEDETRRAAVDSGEGADEETRRQASSLADEGSDEETRRAFVASEENVDDETRRQAGVAEEQEDHTEDGNDEEEDTRRDATNLEGTSDGGTRRFQKNVNVNQNVNTNINSNVQIDPMGFPRDEEYRPHYRPDANLQQYIPDDVLEKLHTCDIFRDNIIFVMGYLLRLPDGQLSAHEYSSLEMIYKALKAKSIYMYNLLSTLRFLRQKSLSKQFAIVLRALGKNSPLYMKSAWEFWIKRVNEYKINLDLILSQTPETNILAGISDQAFSNNMRYDRTNEMRAYDDGSRITEELMGPIYVTIFYQLSQMKTNFSQSLFGTILRDIPNTNNDPIFEEYVRYIAEETWDEKIPNWSQHCRNIDAKNPYALVVSLVDNICADDVVSLQMKRALLYIRHHFTDSGRKILRNAVRDARTITENGLNIDMLFKVVVPFHTDDIDELKFRLRAYLLPSPDKDVTRILSGINRFKYNTPTDLLSAFLARLQMRMPSNSDIQTVASALLSNLLFPTTIQDISPPENGPIAFWIMIDSIVEPETNETIKLHVTSLQKKLFSNLKLWDKIQAQLMPTRHECTYPRKCLFIILKKFKIILENNTTLLPKDIEDHINKLTIYVRSNLENKNTPRPCFNTAMPLLVPSSNSKTPQKPGKKEPRPSTKQSKIGYKPSKSTHRPLFSTPNLLKIKNKTPRILGKSVRKTTESPKIITQPQTITPKWPKMPSKIIKLTSKPIKVVDDIPKLTIEPSKMTLNPSKATSKSSNILPDTLTTTTNQPKKTTQPPQLTTKLPKLSTELPKAITEKLKTTSKPQTVTPKPTKPTNINDKPPKLTAAPSQAPIIVTERPITTAKSPKKESSLVSEKTSTSPQVTKAPKKKTTPPKMTTETEKEKKTMGTPKMTTNPPKIKVTPIKTTPEIIIQSPKTTTKSVKHVTELEKSTDKPSKLKSELKNSSSESKIKSTKSVSESIKSTSPSSTRKPSKTENLTVIKLSTNKVSDKKPRADESSLDKNSILPPNMNAQECIVFDIKSDDFSIAPNIYTQADTSNLSSTTIIFPSMVELHADIIDDRDIVDDVNKACVKQLITEILFELNKTMGESYKIRLLGKNWKLSYPTRISALMGIMEGALRYPKVVADTKLRRVIERYRNGLQFIAPYIYLPMLSRWKKFNGEIVWSSIDLDSHDFSIIANSPPKEMENNIMTLPLTNPSNWILPINQKDGDPFAILLPRLPTDSKYAKKLKPLIDIFTHEKIKSTIGQSIDFSMFPNRGALFLHTLIQLQHHKIIQKNVSLLQLIKLYLNILQQPAMYIRIPQEVITDERYDIRGGWTVDTIDLMELLPKPKSPADTKLYETMRGLLSRPNLLVELKIPIPPMETTKGTFMELLIKKALKTDSIISDGAMKMALKYYQDKFDSKNRGRMNLGWIWSQKFIVSTEMHLGELIEKLLPYKELTRPDQRAYDDLVVYFTNHPHFLNTHSLPLTEYKTRGSFVRGFFEHLLDETALDNKVKEKVKKLLPRVKMTGEGAKSMPPLARKAMPLVRSTWK